MGQKRRDKEKYPLSTEQNKAVVRRYFEGDRDGRDNVAVWDEVCDPNMVLFLSMLPQPLQGLEPIKQLAITNHSAFSDFGITVEDMVAEGDKVVGRITVRGTNTGSVMGMPPTGKQVTISGIFTRRLAGGRFVEGWDAPDTLSLMQQLGVIPTPQQGGS